MWSGSRLDSEWPETTPDGRAELRLNDKEVSPTKNRKEKRERMRGGQ